jgi:protoporphyrinogen oxidase
VNNRHIAQESSTSEPIVIIGGGPAGLTAAYELVKRGHRPVVLEKADKVGGLSRTEQYKGYRFDMGGHRFYTKSQEVKKMWEEVLGKEFLRRPRLSRIFYNRRFFYYPLKPLNVLWNLGLVESIRIIVSYLRWQLLPYKQEETFEQWVTNRFGRRLFLVFFKTYTEKVWGIPCSALKAEWAAQRIKDLSVKTALVHMFLKPAVTVKTLIEEFDYPRLGPGMMWQAVKEEVEKRNGVVELNTDVVEIIRDGNVVRSVITACNGQTREIRGSHFISSMPLTEFIKKLRPASDRALHAADQLHYRDFLTVCLIVDQPDLFPDNWIYIHDPSVKVGRIQNFKNWSPDMVHDPMKTSLGLEYFCTEGDALWEMPDADLIELAKSEIDRIGLARYADIVDGCVFRVPKAYPVYDSDYRDHLAEIRRFTEGLLNVTSIGRNGLHRYNNQDHAMLTGMLAVRNLIAGERHDLWSVNADQAYHEEIYDDTRAKETDAAEAIEEALVQVFARVDRMALGLSVGTITAALLFAMTVALVLKGGPVVGPNLQLLSQFFPGYSVTRWGSVVGLGYGFAAGYLVGWSTAFLRNLSVFLSIRLLRSGAERRTLRDLFDYV